MNHPHYITHGGSRIRVQPGSYQPGSDPPQVYEGDLRDKRIEELQTGPWQAKADVLDTYIDEPFARLVAFVATHAGSLGCVNGTPEQRESMNETFVGLAEEAAKRLDAQIEEHLKSTWGRREYEPHYCEEE